MHQPITKDAPADLPINAVVVEGLRKVYAGRGAQPANEALKGIDLTIPRGSIFGLLGPNGAGKSTLINILAGLVNPTAGKARIWDYDVVTAPRMARSSIGIVPQEQTFDPFFTPRALLEMQAGMYGVPKRERITDQLLEIVGLLDRANASPRSLSGGMRRRLMMAKALVHRPPVLVLDEPTAGVDIELRQTLWQHVRHLNAEGATVLLTTHYLEEAEELCDHIAIIDRGQVVANDRKANMLGRLDSKHVTVVTATDLPVLPEALIARGWQTLDPRRLALCYRPSRTSMTEVLEEIRQSGIAIADITTSEADLEDIFLQLTKR